MAGSFFAFMITAAHFFQRHWDADGLTIAQNIQLDARTGLLLSHLDLKLAGIADFLTGLFGWRSILHLADHGSFIVLDVEEFCILRCHVADADSHVTVTDLAVADQSFHGGTDDLRWNGKAHARKAIRTRDEEGIDSDHLATSVHKRSTRVSRVDGRIGLNETSRRAAILRERIRTVEAADDAPSHGEAEAERIAEGKPRLGRAQGSGITPRCIGKIRSVHFDNREVSERISTDQLGM